jgi:hypothetical protein
LHARCASSSWIKDPDGNRIELMQLMPDSLQDQGIAKRRGAGTR